MIVVTGASGHVGRLVARELAGRKIPARLVVRDRSRITPQQQAEVAVADYSDSAALAEALHEGDRVFMVSIHASIEQRVELHRSFIETAVRQRVAHITYLSFVNAGPDATFLQAMSHGTTEDMLRASGVAWTSMRNNMYADHIPQWFDGDGVLREPAGDARMSFTYRPELAKAIAVTLTEPGHEGATYSVTTPEAVSMAELASIATAVTGRPYAYQPATDDHWRSRWLELGRSDWETEAGASSYVALRTGELDVVTDDYRRLTGLVPLSVRAIVASLAGALPLTCVVDSNPPRDEQPDGAVRRTWT